MSTKREPLLGDEQISDLAFKNEGRAAATRYAMGAEVRDFYEAARAKDAELIQMLVNALEFERMSLVSCMESKKALDAAAAAGFKPSEQ